MQIQQMYLVVVAVVATALLRLKLSEAHSAIKDSWCQARSVEAYLVTMQVSPYLGYWPLGAGRCSFDRFLGCLS